MRRLLRILFNVATALSLLLCVASVALCLRSYYVIDHVYLWGFRDVRGKFDETIWRQDLFESRDGRIGMQRLTQSGSRMQGAQTFRERVEQRFGADPVHVATAAGHPYRYGPLPETLGSRWAGFQYHSSDAMKTKGASRWIVSGPFWALTLPLSAAPIAWVWLWHRRRKRAPAGTCPACGYDLRATPDRCPECGTALVAAAGPAREGKGETEGV